MTLGSYSACPSPALISGFPGGFIGPLLGDPVSPQPTPYQKYPIALGTHFCRWPLPATTPSLGPLQPLPFPTPTTPGLHVMTVTTDPTAKGAEIPAARGWVSVGEAHPSLTHPASTSFGPRW